MTTTLRKAEIQERVKQRGDVPRYAPSAEGLWCVYWKAPVGGFTVFRGRFDK
jgi:hypothetical protein